MEDGSRLRRVQGSAKERYSLRDYRTTNRSVDERQRDRLDTFQFHYDRFLFMGVHPAVAAVEAGVRANQDNRARSRQDDRMGNHHSRRKTHPTYRVWAD